MSALTERINEIRRDLELLRAKRREVLTAGEQVQVAGGVSVRNSSLEALAAEERRLQRELMILDGGPFRTAPDFSGGSY
jgi:hypothetical protein